MNIQQPKVDLKNNFELYLEGIKVDFNSISISEMEGGIPAASVSFPANYGALRLLPGTIVQIFGYVQAEKKSFLLFEGELTDVNYQKSEMAKVVSIKAISLLGSMIKAKFRPSDAILTLERKSADGMSQDKVIIVNNKTEDSSVGQSTAGDLANPEKKDSQIISGTTKDLGVTAVFGLTDDFNILMGPDQPGGKGDFIPMLQKFNTNFENNDLYYGLKSLAYRFGRTIFASPNPELLNKIKVDLWLEAIKKLQSGISDIFGESPYTLIQILSEFQRYLHYNFISPAAYTACKPFYIKGSDDTLEPLRMVYLPKIESGPPAMCNVFFPEQVSSFTYSRPMMEEATRVIGKATTPFINKGKTGNIDYSQCYTYPELDINQEKAVANFTREETYRGINYKVTEYSNLHSDMIIDKKTTTSNGKKTTSDSVINEDDAKGEISYIIRPYAYMDYLDMKYLNRQMSINSEWNPYRMIGLPGLMLDSDGVSILGVVNSIETNISAMGQASSRVTFRSCRLIYDGEFEKSVFSSQPSSNPTDAEKYVIHDLTNDGVMSTNELLYFKDLYDFEHIGRDVYTYILHGQLSKNRGFYNASVNNNVFQYAKDKLANSIEENLKFDSSILSYLPIVNGSYGVNIPEVYNKKSEIRNTYLLYKAIVELKKDYESKKYKTVSGQQKFDMKNAHNYIHLVNKRNLLTKELYFNFIGAKPDRELQTDDAHDAYTIFRDGTENLRAAIHARSDYQYNTIVTTDNAELMGNKSAIDAKTEELNEANNSGKIKSYNDALNYFKDSEYFKAYTEKYQKEKADEKWKLISALTKELSELKTIRTEIKKKVDPTSEIKFEVEIYKPYNITRRMHVLLGFKDSIEVKVNNNVTKIKVTK